jgi:hypothetical protein
MPARNASRRITIVAAINSFTTGLTLPCCSFGATGVTSTLRFNQANVAASLNARELNGR